MTGECMLGMLRFAQVLQMIILNKRFPPDLQIATAAAVGGLSDLLASQVERWEQ